MTEITTVFDRFTELAKRALVASRDAADSLGAGLVGTEHLLLGLAQTAGTASEVLRAQGLDLARARAQIASLAAESKSAAPGGDAAEALSTLGIDVSEIQRRADETFGPGAFQYPRPAFSLRMKMVVKQSLEQARDLGAEVIDTEHLLLGLLAHDAEATPDTAAQVLEALGINPDILRQAVHVRIAQ